MKIFEDRIIYKKAEHVCRLMRLQVVKWLEDDIGKYAALMEDQQHRRYLFACKRYIDWSPKNYGRVSFTKSLVEESIAKKWTLIMLIEEEGRDYIYTYNPQEILAHPDTYDNTFNAQLMCNFNIELALNVEMTRRREITRMRVKLKAQTPIKKKD